MRSHPAARGGGEPGGSGAGFGGGSLDGCSKALPKNHSPQVEHVPPASFSSDSPVLRSSFKPSCTTEMWSRAAPAELGVQGCSPPAVISKNGQVDLAHADVK